MRSSTAGRGGGVAASTTMAPPLLLPPTTQQQLLDAVAPQPGDDAAALRLKCRQLELLCMVGGERGHVHWG